MFGEAHRWIKIVPIMYTKQLYHTDLYLSKIVLVRSEYFMTSMRCFGIGSGQRLLPKLTNIFCQPQLSDAMRLFKTDLNSLL